MITTSFHIINGFLFLQLFSAHSSKSSVKQENRKEIIKNLRRTKTSYLDKNYEKTEEAMKRN